jgi:hypothetical protein
MQNERNIPKAQCLLVDGCKVTLRYTEQENPNAIGEIKAILLAASIGQKNGR